MIRVEHLDFTPGDRRTSRFALRDLSVEIPQGAYCVLLGPTGSGKTLFLECLCGLNRIDAGRIILHDDDVTSLPPRERRVGYVPQDYALFPHMTVLGNILFARHLARDPSMQRPEDVMRLLHIAHLADRRPEKLSGGEKQRVALARALCSQPGVLLLDEPVSALDEQTRRGVLAELKSMQRATGITTVHVCHDFTEMMTVADSVLVLEQGRKAQLGPPGDVLRRPATPAIARFVGTENILDVQGPPTGTDDGHIRLPVEGGFEVAVERDAHDEIVAEHPNGRLKIAVRPEHVRMLPRDAATRVTPSPDVSLIGATVRDAIDQGATARVTFGIENETIEIIGILARADYNGLDVQLGASVLLTIRAGDVHLIPAE